MRWHYTSFPAMVSSLGIKDIHPLPSHFLHTPNLTMSSSAPQGIPHSPPPYSSNSFYTFHQFICSPLPPLHTTPCPPLFPSYIPHHAFLLSFFLSFFLSSFLRPFLLSSFFIFSVTNLLSLINQKRTGDLVYSSAHFLSQFCNHN